MKAKVVLITVGVLLLAAAIGAPVAAWCACLGAVAFAFGCGLTMVGADAIGSKVLGAGVSFLFAALAVGTIGGGLRVLLADPHVELGLGLVVALLLLLGLVAALVQLFGHAEKAVKTHKYPVSERVSVVEPIFAPPPVSHSAPSPGRTPTRQAKPDAPDVDELGIFRRRQP